MRDLVSHVRISFTEIKSVGVDERREHHAKPELDATLAVCINRRSGDKSRWNEFPHIWPRDIKRLDAVNRGSLPCRRSVRHPGTELGRVGSCADGPTTSDTRPANAPSAACSTSCGHG